MSAARDPDDGDALALPFAQPVEPAEVEEQDEKTHLLFSLSLKSSVEWTISLCGPPDPPPHGGH
jgi:hypothetical protein